MSIASPDIVRAATTAAFDNYANTEMGRHLAQAVHDQYLDGDLSAVYIPAVRYLIDTTLAVVEDPAVSAYAPNTLYERANLASGMATRLAMQFVDVDLFAQLHSSDPILSTLPLDDEAWSHFRDKPALVSLATAPFADARFLCGGAVRLLRREQPLPDTIATIIGQSTSLLAWSRMDKQQADKAFAAFGQRYMHSRYLQVRSGQTADPKVEFTGSAYRRLRQFYSPDSGCPFGRLAAPEGQSLTPMAEYWQRIVNYLVPDTVSVV